jgi:hypothetical protein
MPGWHFTLVAVSSFLLVSSSHTASQTTTNLAIRSASPESGWTIAEARHIEGYPVTLGSLGSEIDDNERHQFHLFDGILDRSSALYPFQTAIPGFVLAEIFESKPGQLFIAVTYRTAGRERKRVIHIKSANLDALQKRLGANTQAVEVAATLSRISTTRDVYAISKRQRAKVRTSDNIYAGHLLPVIEDATIYMALQDGSTQQIRPEDIEQLTIQRSITGQIAGSTAGRGIQGALAGTAAGLIAGWTLGGHSAFEEMRLGAVTGGIVGLGIGILDGIFSAERSKTYTFHPKVQPEAMELYLTMTF